ncbi:MAG: Maf family protein [Spirochaetaceae bacterium]|jgi:septum formation protein|nr:Maf family protein [Spirochaetaceae bacterium]
MESIILASGSLRRQGYFRLLGLPFSVMSPQIDESYEGILPPRELAGDLAVRKVRRALELIRNSPPWILGADTLVELDGEVLGKPGDRSLAAAMLKKLQNREHRVVTAMALYNRRTQNIDCRSVSSSVTFAPLGDGEIEWYLDTGEWQGVAGAYQAQGLAACFIEAIHGSYSAVVGLPLHECYVMLRENGYEYGAKQE